MAQTFREWFQECADHHRLVTRNGDFSAPLDIAAEMQRLSDWQLDTPIEVVTTNELYADYGYIGHIARPVDAQLHVAYVWMEPTAERVAYEHAKEAH